jgi:predicted HicB family RNase H-like nuclease
MKKRFSIQTTETLHQKLTDEAKKQNRSLSNLINTILNNFFNKK